MDASGRLFSDDEDGQSIFEGPQARILLMERPAKEQDPGLIFLLFFSLLGLILIVDVHVRRLFRFPRKPGGIIYVAVVLRRFFNGFGRPVER